MKLLSPLKLCLFGIRTRRILFGENRNLSPEGIRELQTICSEKLDSWFSVRLSVRNELRIKINNGKMEK